MPMNTRDVRPIRAVAHFDGRRHKVAILHTHAEAHLWTDQFHPFLRRQLICGEICGACADGGVIMVRSLGRRKGKTMLTYL